MAIEDPTAIPESPEQVTEYMTAADQLWNDSRTDDAHVLYRSVFNSPVAAAPQSSLSGYRLALYLQTIGDVDGALGYVAYTTEPGTHDLEIALHAEMPDQVVDPSVVPQTMEACERYAQSIVSAFERSDWTTVEALVLAYQDTSIDVGIGRHALMQSFRGPALVHLGRNDEARPVLEYVIANSINDDGLARAHAAMQQIGIQVDDGGNPYETDDSRNLLAGIAAFEGGDEASATIALQSVVDSDAGDSDKGRAHFYLGSMAYHGQRYDEARTHLHAARSTAPEPEQGWTNDILSWRWQEE
ncbi:MAG: tetratricopeptide repeat protein [Ilumatobacteraceae bacterium]